MVIISLSTIPPRFGMLGQVLQDLVTQSAGIDQIRVNIPNSYRRFPEGSFSVPEVPEGVTIVRVDEDYGPATKVLPTIQAFRDSPKTRIIYCDDDRELHPQWAQRLLDAGKRVPGHCVANCGWDLAKIGVHPRRGPEDHGRAIPMRSILDVPYRFRRLVQQGKDLITGRKSLKPQRNKNFIREGLIDIMEGYGGVLIQPGFFAPDVFEVPERVWSVDDIWLSGMAARRGIRIWASNGYVPREIQGAEDVALSQISIEGLDRKQANLACVRYLQDTFNVWPEEGAPQSAGGKD